MPCCLPSLHETVFGTIGIYSCVPSQYSLLVTNSFAVSLYKWKDVELSLLCAVLPPLLPLLPLPVMRGLSH